MKKIIIIAAVIVSSGLTAYCLNTKQNKASVETTLKINKADFSAKATSSVGPAVGSAD